MPKRLLRNATEVGLLIRQAQFEPTTYNAEARTVELVWTTGARVRRSGFFTDDWEEELSLDEGAVRMGRLENGAPLLDNHGFSRLSRSQIGVVERAWFVGRGKKRQGRALVRFSEREEVEDIIRDVAAGILRGVSVGYRIFQVRDVTKKGDALTVLRVIDWEPHELSLTPIQADAASVVRTDHDAGVNRCVLVGSGSRSDSTIPATRSEPMEWTEILRALVRAAGLPSEFADELVERDLAEGDTKAAQRAIEQELERRKAAETPPADPPADPGPAEPVTRAEVQQAVTEERERSNGIRCLVAQHNLPARFAEDLVARGVTVHAAQSEVLERLAARSAETPVNGGHGGGAVQVGEEQLDKVRSGIEAALEHRCVRGSELRDEGKAFRGMSLLRMGEEILRVRGVEYSHEPGDLALRVMGMHGTDDFPSILANVANKGLRKAYEAAPRTYQAISARSNASDFKPMSRVAIGLGSSLARVNEHGEFAWGTFTEMGETYQIDEYGRIVAITRKAIINDDVSAFGRIPRAFGSQAALLENRSAWNILINNAAMADGNQLFSAAHNNDLTPDAALDKTGLSAIRTAMRKQTDPDSNSLNLTPRILIVPAELETTAQELTAQLTPAATTNVNPFASQFSQVIVESHLDGAAGGDTRWFVAADPALIDILEYAYLDGNEGPVIETQDGFEQSGVKLRVRHDFGVAPLEFRGIARSNGTT